MTFASGYFLLLLIPWAVVSILLLLGQRPVQEVPFVKLWHGPVHPPRQKRSLYPPPASILLAILAMLLAVLSASRPEVARSRENAAATQPSPADEAAKLIYLSARNDPTPQVMVKVRGKGTVVIETGESIIRRPVDASNGEVTEFIPAPQLDTGTKVGMAESSDRWRVEVHQSWPILEPRSAVPGELGRMIETYRQRRPPGERSEPLAIVSSVDEAGERPAIVLPSAGRGSSSEPAKWSDHPIFQSVRLNSATEFTTAPVPAKFSPVAWLGDRPVVAIREIPSRQVWVGLHGTTWSQSPDFVVFWTNVFDWTGQGSEELKVIPPATPTSGAKPLVVGADRLALAPVLLWAGLGALVLSAGLWGRSEKRAKVEG